MRKLLKLVSYCILKTKKDMGNRHVHSSIRAMLEPTKGGAQVFRAYNSHSVRWVDMLLLCIVFCSANKLMKTDEKSHHYPSSHFCLKICKKTIWRDQWKYRLTSRRKISHHNAYWRHTMENVPFTADLGLAYPTRFAQIVISVGVPNWCAFRLEMWCYFRTYARTSL